MTSRGLHTENGSVVLDVSGNGTIKLAAPRPYRVKRYVRMSVTIDTGNASLGGECKVYAGDSLPINLIDGTESPWLDTATWSLEQAVVRSPNQLTAVFLGCDPNATARLDCTYVEDTSI